MNSRNRGSHGAHATSNAILRRTRALQAANRPLRDPARLHLVVVVVLLLLPVPTDF
jgi:hypothetical protein